MMVIANTEILNVGLTSIPLIFGLRSEYCFYNFVIAFEDLRTVLRKDYVERKYEYIPVG